MRFTQARRFVPLSPLAVIGLIFGCETPPDQRIVGIEAPSFITMVWSAWSEPVNLGATINSSFVDAQPNLSRDGLSLYFTSNRPGGEGANDLWVARRACEDCPWEAPVNLGSVINTASFEAGSDLTVDGHALFFHSDRPGGLGSNNDIYVSRRTDPNDDLGWGSPQVLGAEVNTAAAEQVPTFFQNDLFFTRGNPVLQQQDLYVAPVNRHGEIGGPAVPIAELNHPTVNDAAASVRADGRELFYHRGPGAGGLGLADIWVATRRGASGPWSSPVNAGAPINTASLEQQPSLSHDGRTLVWASERAGGFGFLDIWMSTRAPIGN